MRNPNWWKTKTQQWFVQSLRDSNIPVSSIAKKFNNWVVNKSQEPFAAVIRDALRAGKNGCRSRHKHVGADHVNSRFYKETFVRVQEFVSWINLHGKPLSKVIANESIAHRWGDLFFFTLKLEYEEKMVFHYLEAYKWAIKCRSWKNVDSSLFWLADTYRKVSEKNGKANLLWLKKAKDYYCQVCNRPGPRFTQSLHQRKIRQSKNYCKQL